MVELYFSAVTTISARPVSSAFASGHPLYARRHRFHVQSVDERNADCRRG
jgi:hypothetical protein